MGKCGLLGVAINSSSICSHVLILKMFIITFIFYFLQNNILNYSIIYGKGNNSDAR